MMMMVVGCGGSGGSGGDGVRSDRKRRSSTSIPRRGEVIR